MSMLGPNSKDICTTLLSAQSLLSAVDVDITSYVDDAFQTVLTKHDHRQQSLDVLALYLSPLSTSTNTSSSAQQSTLKRVIPLIDRVSVLLESVELHETASVLFLVRVLSAFRHTEIASHWHKTMIKIAPLIQRLLRKNNALLNDVQSKYHSLLSQHTNTQTARHHQKTNATAVLAGAAVNSAVCAQVENERDELMLRIVFLVDVLTVMLNSPLRATLLPSVKILRDVLTPFLALPGASSSAVAENLSVSVIEALALLTSCEAPDAWSTTLQSTALDMILSLKTLSLPLPSSLFAHLNALEDRRVQLVNWQELAQEFERKQVHGVAKALWVNAIFERLARLYAQIISTGCSAGYVGFDLTPMFALNSALLALGLDANTTDPANFIENEQKVSVVDISFVLSKLKVSQLGAMQALLQLNLPGFIRYGGLFVQPTLSLLARREASLVPDLLVAALSLLRIAACVLPTALSLAINNGATILVDLLQKQMHAVCVNRSKAAASLILNSTASGSSSSASTSLAQAQLDLLSQGKLQNYEETEVEEDNDLVVIAVFEAVEALLVHCGAELSLVIRSDLAQTVQQGLQCLQLGVLSVSFADRRLRRTLLGERVRSSPALQSALLRLAAAEVLAAAKTGLMSTNVQPLRAVCLALTKLPFATNSFQSIAALRERDFAAESLPHEATKTLLVLGQILYPSAIPMPAFAPADLAKQYVAKIRQAEEEAPIAEQKNEQSKKRAAVEESETQEPQAEVVKSVKPKKQKKDVAPAAVVEKKATAPVAAKPLNLPPPVRTNAAAANAADEDSDDIPDIDMGDDEDD